MARNEDIYAEYLRSTIDGLLVTASIVATVTCQIAISPPGGFWQDSSPSPEGGSESSDSTAPVHVAGNAILYDRSRNEYTAFVILNTQVFLASICLIVALVRPNRSAAKWVMIRNLTNLLAFMVIVLFFMAVEFTTKQKLYEKPLHYILVAPWLFAIGWLIGRPIRQNERDPNDA